MAAYWTFFFFTYYQVFIVIIFNSLKFVATDIKKNLEVVNFTVLYQFKTEMKEKIKASIDTLKPEDVNNSNMTSSFGYLNIKMIKFIIQFTSHMRIFGTIVDTTTGWFLDIFYFGHLSKKFIYYFIFWIFYLNYYYFGIFV